MQDAGVAIELKDGGHIGYILKRYENGDVLASFPLVDQSPEDAELFGPESLTRRIPAVDYILKGAVCYVH